MTVGRKRSRGKALSGTRVEPLGGAALLAVGGIFEEAFEARWRARGRLGPKETRDGRREWWEEVGRGGGRWGEVARGRKGGARHRRSLVAEFPTR
ncbi:hypothetical protein KM043_006082 [Ampulex compressa]|nr:hypothetical protein KM043_006082 [Ampulex compressa]